jgi:hypothetical protein
MASLMPLLLRLPQGYIPVAQYQDAHYTVCQTELYFGERLICYLIFE